MNHSQFAEEFRSIANKFDNLAIQIQKQTQDVYNIYGKVRSQAEKAGKLLFEAIENNVVIPFCSYPLWLRCAYYNDIEVIFRSITSPNKVFLNEPHHIFLTNVKAMLTLQCKQRRNNENVTPDDLRRFFHHHIFLEAVISWLPGLFPDELNAKSKALYVLNWTTIIKNKVEISFVSDFMQQDISPDKSNKSVHIAGPLTQLYKQTCNVLSQHIGEITQFPPDKLIKGFQSSLDKFKDINKRYSGTGKLHKDLLRELYAEASKAGVLLIMGIRSNLIVEPKNQPPWLHHSIRNTRTRFIGYESTHGVSTSFSPANFYELIKSFIGPESVMYCFEKTCKSEDECTAYLYRHVFLEAVTNWLPKRHQGQVSVVSLFEWEVETTTGDTISFISTWSGCRNESDEVPFAIELLSACCDACNVLKDNLVSDETADSVKDDLNTVDNYVNEFYKKGNVWHIRFGDESTTLHHVYGLCYIHTCLDNPNKTIPVEMMHACAKNEKAYKTIRTKLAKKSSQSQKEQLRLRKEIDDDLENLQIELQEAKDKGIDSKVEDLQEQIDKIEKYKKSSNKTSEGDLGNITRNVYNSYNRALGDIRLPKLQAYLKEHIQTGASWKYSPETAHPWRLLE